MCVCVLINDIGNVLVIIISKRLKRYLKVKRTNLFTSAATNQRGFSRRVVKRSSGPISRIPEGDRVAVKVGVVLSIDLVGELSSQIASPVLVARRQINKI